MGFFDSISDAFSRNGSVTRIFEKIPVVGYGVAAVQAIAGNTEEAKRAVATSTNSLITTAGAVGGMVVGGPLGAVAGGAAAAQLGMVTEWGISKTITDEKVKGDVGEISLERGLKDGLLGGVSGLIGGGTAATAVGKEAGKVVLTQGGKALASVGIKQAGGLIGKEIGESLAKAVTTASLASLSQGASKGLLTKSTAVQAGKIRVVTIGQDQQARKVEGLCDAINQRLPIQPIADLVKSVHLYWNTVVVTGLPWEFANTAVNLQVAEYTKKFAGVANIQPVLQRVTEALQVCEATNNPPVLAEWVKGQTVNGVMEGWLYPRILELNTELAKLQQLMQEQIEYGLKL